MLGIVGVIPELHVIVHIDIRPDLRRQQPEAAPFAGVDLLRLCIIEPEPVAVLGFGRADELGNFVLRFGVIVEIHRGNVGGECLAVLQKHLLDGIGIRCHGAAHHDHARHKDADEQQHARQPEVPVRKPGDPGFFLECHYSSSDSNL